MRKEESVSRAMEVVDIQRSARTTRLWERADRVSRLALGGGRAISFGPHTITHFDEALAYASERHAWTRRVKEDCDMRYRVSHCTP